ncbi:MAG: hypothetical protein DRJ32_03615 [Thermoprotei archaeon]|nr:MAG: hypothetical protein DRJ32_03615 [Thermoprotei archaeon]
MSEKMARELNSIRAMIYNIKMKMDAQLRRIDYQIREIKTLNVVIREDIEERISLIEKRIDALENEVDVKFQVIFQAIKALNEKIEKIGKSSVNTDKD